MLGAVHVVVPPLLEVEPPELLVEPPLELDDPPLLLLLLLEELDSPSVASPPDEPGSFVELSLAGLVVVDSTEQATSEDTTAAAASAAKGWKIRMEGTSEWKGRGRVRRSPAASYSKARAMLRAIAMLDAIHWAKHAHLG